MSAVVVTLTVTTDTEVSALVAPMHTPDGRPFVALNLGGMSVYFAGLGADQMAQLDRLIHTLMVARVDLERLDVAWDAAHPVGTDAPPASGDHQHDGPAMSDVDLAAVDALPF